MYVHHSLEENEISGPKMIQESLSHIFKIIFSEWRYFPEDSEQCVQQWTCVNSDRIFKIFYSPTDAQVSCFKNNIKIYIKTAPTRFGAVTPSSESALFVLAKVTVVKIVH